MPMESYLEQTLLNLRFDTDRPAKKKYTGVEMKPNIAYRSTSSLPVEELTIMEAFSKSFKVMVGENTGKEGVNAAGLESRTTRG